MSVTGLLQIQLARIYPSNNDNVTLGSFDFGTGNNQDLLLDILEEGNKKTDKYLSYKAFQNFFNSALQSTHPTKPRQDDPAYNDATRKAIYRAKKYRVYKLWRYQTDLKKYHDALQKHQAQQAYLRTIQQTYRNNPRGYIAFVRASLSESENAFFLRPQPFSLNEAARQKHTYITGQSGSGKTELLKTFIHHYLTKNTKTSVILIDPHGDIAEQVAQFKENVDSDRLVYIDPFLSSEHTPVLNPFVLPKKDTPPQVIDLIAEEIYLVFREVLKSSFTAQMETVLRPCITTLLLMGNKDLNDLQRFMDDEKNSHYLDFAFTHLYNPSQVEFMKVDFHKDSYNPTKQAIKTKIQSLLNSHAFRNLLTGKQTLNLEQLTKQKKLIIFNLSAGIIGNDTSDVIGKFLLAQIKSMAFQRAVIPKHLRTPTHVFIDECQRYISPSIEIILSQSRKYKIYLTLANQYYGQNMGTETRSAITNNTAVKIAGKNGDKNAVTHHKETGANVEELKGLTVGQFHIKEDVKPSVKVTAPSTLIDDKNAMTAEQWESVRKDMIAMYYRPLGQINVDEFIPRANQAKDNQKAANEVPEKNHKMAAKTHKINPHFEIDV